jgi:hypothetical protein
MSYELLRNAQVEVISHKTTNGVPVAQIIVNDHYDHIFAPDSRISQALSVMTEEQLRARLTGGTYFFIGEKLIDFRDHAYTGFIHDDAAINKLMDVLGVRAAESDSERRIMRLNTVTSGELLNKQWLSDDFEIPGYMSGGEFTTNIGFTWNPFSSSVRGIFEIVRQICSNGMVGMNEIINSKVPLINRWEEHLDISAIQLRNMVVNHTQKRMVEMGRERATVSELQLIRQHALARLVVLDNVNNSAIRSTLQNIAKVSNPETFLSDVYSQEVFTNSKLGSRAEAHLTRMDAWNLVTEIFSHTLENVTSSGSALQRMANSMVFPAKDHKQSTVINTHKPIVSAFSDPEIAFFGQLVTNI